MQFRPLAPGAVTEGRREQSVEAAREPRIAHIDEAERQEALVCGGPPAQQQPRTGEPGKGDDVGELEREELRSVSSRGEALRVEDQCRRRAEHHHHGGEHRAGRAQPAMAVRLARADQRDLGGQ